MKPCGFQIIRLCPNVLFISEHEPNVRRVPSPPRAGSEATFVEVARNLARVLKQVDKSMEDLPDDLNLIWWSRCQHKSIGADCLVCRWPNFGDVFPAFVDDQMLQSIRRSATLNEA